jgi:hypothetical protein
MKEHPEMDKAGREFAASVEALRANAAGMPRADAQRNLLVRVARAMEEALREPVCWRPEKVETLRQLLERLEKVLTSALGEFTDAQREELRSIQDDFGPLMDGER